MHHSLQIGENELVHMALTILIGYVWRYTHTHTIYTSAALIIVGTEWDSQCNGHANTNL